jgi:hypothetical protein
MSLVSYGGDPRIVATHSEIERGRSTLQLAQDRLRAEFELTDFLIDPVQRGLLALHAPGILFRIEKLQWACASAAEAYLSVEARVTNRIHWITQFIAQHPLLMALIPIGVRGTIPLALMGAVAGTQLIDGKTSRVLARETIDAYSSLTGGRASSGDDAKAGAQQMINQAGLLGVLGANAPALAGVGAMPMRAAPNSVAQITSRLAQTHHTEKPTIVIERYADGKRNLFMVYLPGMRSKNPFNIAEPFNVAASVHELADSEHAACQLAARDALQNAGVGKGDSVVFAGYSQGGLVAAELAAAGKHNVVGIITVGAPVGHVTIPDSIPVMSLEHANDVVPAIAGKLNPLTENWVTVGREVEVKFGQTALVAHELPSYQKTAEMIDESSSIGVARIRDQLLGKFDGFRLVETQTFKYEGGR